MDIKMVQECFEHALAGEITFQEHANRLDKAGTERYTGDLIAMKKSYYGLNDEIHIVPLTCDAVKVPTNFNNKEISNAINDSLQNRIDYQTFLHRAMSAGCSHYEVFLRGKKAIYFGRDGSLHVENFPQAK